MNIKILNPYYYPINITQNSKVMCIGFFDGIHRGHQKLLETTMQLKQAFNLESWFLTFTVPPKSVVRAVDYRYECLTPEHIKQQLVARYNFEYYGRLAFNNKIKDLNPIDFIKWLKSLNVKILVVGENFRFGKKAAGTIDDLKKYFEVVTVPLVNVGYKDCDLNVSSTNIKNELSAGNINNANAMLGYNYFLAGTVIKGKQLGRLINYPTMNVYFNKNAPLHKGVYWGYVHVSHKRYNALICVLDKGDSKLLTESYLFNFHLGEIYNQKIIVEFAGFLRFNEKINNLEELKILINQDVKNYQQIYNICKNHVINKFLTWVKP